ncbi:MAG TPA: STAS domain-containing protein [Spirochaetota bacterium]|nr:STAS domain-containing protein [Spirochaetota bacterium]
MKMTVRTEYRGKSATLFIEGNIDASNSADLYNFFQEVLDKNTITSVYLDLGNVVSITSSGIGKIRKFYKCIDEAGGEFKIVRVGERVMSLLKDINLDKIIPVSK